jgi:hypothetical protein
MRSKTILSAILVTAMLGLARQAAAAGSDLWLHIKVHEKEGGARVSVNLPVSAVGKMAGALPSDAHHIRIKGEGDMDAADLRRMWEAVRDSPDAEFVTVEERDDHVRVAKRGNYLVIRADERGARRSQVDVKVPTAVIEALLSGPRDELNLSAALEALARHGEGELVTVDDGGDTVRIWVDRAAESR